MERGPRITKNPVQILTPNFQITGQMEVIGPPMTFLNDPSREGVIIHDVRVAPLATEGRFKGFSQSQITLNRLEILLLYFPDPNIRSSIQALTRKESYIVYTPSAILRGHFHMSAEAQATDFLSLTSGDFLPFTDAQVFSLHPLSLPYPERADMFLVGKKHLHIYHLL